MPQVADLSVQYLPTDAITGYARNARTHSDEQIAQIAASIKEFGFTSPILIDDDDTIIAGHGRLAAAIRLKLQQVPTIKLAGLTPTQRKALVLADNRLALNAAWDSAMLSLELDNLAKEGFSLDLLGFTEDDLKDLLSASEFGAAPTGDEESIPEPAEEATTQLGDVWLLGEHRLMCGDSTNPSDVQELMRGELADLVWTDPPYNVNVEGEAGTILNDDMDSAHFRDFLRDVYRCYFDAMRPGACIYVAHGESERASFTAMFEHAGLKLSQVLIWVKQSATLSRQDFNWQHEPILYGWKEGAGHYFCEDYTRTTVIDDDVDIRKMKADELRDLIIEMRNSVTSTVIRHDRPTKSELHPTMKPVALVKRMIEWSSIKGQIVLDLFGGSGTTLIASHALRRVARIMELDPRYCDVIVKRWQDFTGQQAALERTNQTFCEVENERISISTP